MKKTKFNWREAYERMEKIKGRLNEMAENLENDKQREDLTDAEKGERKQLLREMDILDMKMRANMATIELNPQSDVEEANRKLREAIEGNQRFELKIAREFGGNTSGYANPATSTNPAGVTLHEIVEPLYQRTILSAIGCPLLTGLKGNHVWPVVEAFAASVQGEGVKLGDTKISISKLYAAPQRIGIAIPVTREALTETDDLIRTICTQYMPVAVADLMNKIMFSKEKVHESATITGPFVSIAAGMTLTCAGDTPTYKELLKLKSLVLAKGIRPEQLCYVMTESTKANLEATPKWDSSSEPIIDRNGNICGVPVFTSAYVEEGAVEFGSFKYAPQGLFGDMTFIVDPYTGARSNSIDFVLNVDYAITVLRKEAFALLKPKSSI